MKERIRKKKNIRNSKSILKIRDSEIQKNDFVISIGSKEIILTDKFSLIKGKFKINMICQHKLKNFIELGANLDLIPLEKFLNTLYGAKKKKELNKISGLLEFINNQSKTIRENLNFVSEYINILKLILLTTEINSLKKKKETLEKESEIAKTYKDSRDLNAISDLLTKIKKSIEDNKKRASYLEEDYSLQRNQIEQIEKNISNYDLEIDKLNSQMKMCFTQINQISRLTEISSEDNKNEALKSLGIKIDLSNSEKIRMLQLKAKEISYNIKQAKSIKEDLVLKLNRLYPKYEIYKKDYDKLISIIERDNGKINELENELKKKLREKSGNLTEEISDLNTLRPLNQIDEDIKEVDKKLNEIIQSNKLVGIKDWQDLLSIKEKLGNFSNQISKKANELTINDNKSIFLEALHSYRKFELMLNEIEKIINYFLLEIKILSQFKIVTNETNTSFLIKTLLKKNDNKEITLMELTTPEKVFFTVALYLSLCIVLNQKYIIFSNLFIPNDYNKSGSILRAFRKILPIFKKIDMLSNFNLILILSNIEIKKQIEDIKIIEIKEN
ncbi:MAG: hypothetical protein ACFFEO_00160 [Candidatus Thorarchaeota archaeon]